MVYGMVWKHVEYIFQSKWQFKGETINSCRKNDSCWQCVSFIGF